MITGERSLRLETRTIPTPISISVEARAALERLIGTDGVPLNGLFELPAHDDVAGWGKVKAAVDANYARLLAAASDMPEATVATTRFDGALVHVATPADVIASDAVYLELHGGALVFGGGDACRHGARVQADQLGVTVWSIDYRLPPEHRYPAALDDCLAVYRAAQERHPARRIVVGGRSAGGNLAAAMLLRARDEGLSMPAALVLLSPEVDLTESGDSFTVNAGVDVMLPGSLMANNLLYAGGVDLAHPYLSPLFGDLTGFPPTLLLTGTRDLFLSNTVRMHRRLLAAQVPAELHVFEAMPHGGFGGTPEDRDAAREVTRFVHDRLSRI
ncbi:alpha/beta hydrolase [Sphingomonas sp. RRHST34]|uniref:Alpha/beta hydrolase n=1 Tax=Sphingomonas citri TaxID=2862499 RepID=A0ABS7BQD2_9SPHN|nr:alpha/beta hydrolase [Sphingomonas citri]MBW6531820.1 alpha/beta hydrolase [Sphingomonas citri]